MPPRSKTEMQITAYHEAGHVVVAYLLGYKPTRATLRAQGNSGGHVRHRGISLPTLADRGKSKVLHRFLQRAEHAFMLTVAGAQAEMVYRAVSGLPEEDPASQGVWNNDAATLVHIELSLERAGCPWSKEHQKGLGKRTHDLLSANWDRVQILALAMLVAYPRGLKRKEIIGFMEMNPDDHETAIERLMRLKGLETAEGKS